MVMPFNRTGYIEEKLVLGGRLKVQLGLRYPEDTQMDRGS